jgi:enoyl-CoA hydratase
MSDLVDFSVEDGIATVAINRPEARNAINQAVAEGVAAALDEVESRRDIAVGILTGAGGTFCAGMDLKAYLRGENMRIGERGLAGVTQAVSGKPWIAAIEGHALAGGFELALWCDLIVAAEDAKVGLPEVKRGLVARAGGLLRLPRQLPTRLAAELALTGDIVPIADLARHGFVNSLVPAGQALAAARALAARIAANGPLAVAASKQILRDSPDWEAAERFSRQLEITAPVFASADAKEGAIAFAEKRAPVWRGE